MLDGGDWTRVNAALIPGRITHPDPKAYSLYDWAEAGRYEYKLESISVKGEVETHGVIAGPVEVDAALSGIEDVTPDGFDAAVSNIGAAVQTLRGQALSAKFAGQAGQEAGVGSQGSGVRSQGTGINTQASAAASALGRGANGALVLPATVRAIAPNEVTAQTPVETLNVAARSTAAVAAASPAVSARWFASSGVSTSASFNGVKVLYGASGVLMIPQASLPAGFDINHVSVQREGVSLVPLALTADGLVVFGQGYQDDYTNKDALFLRRISGQTAAGQPMQAQGLFADSTAVNTDTPASAVSTYHDVYFDFSLRPYTYPPWFSSQYLTGGTTQSFTIATPYASAGAASLTINLWSLTQSDTVSPDHNLQVVVNGQPVGQAVWSGGGKMMQLTLQVPSGGLNAGSNQIDLITPIIDGVDTGTGTGQIAFLQSMEIDYTRLLDGSKPVDLYNNSSAAKVFELSHVPSANAWVVDARFPARAALVPAETEVQADGTYTLRFSAAAGGTGHFLVVPAGQENAPTAISKRAVKPLRSPGTYLIVGPSQFSAGVQPLLALRAKEGLKGTFVDQEQLFDYYGYGRYGPTAIQNAVRSARPQYLLLAGRTTYDYLNYSGQNVDPLCPTFLVSTTFWAQATSDSTFGDLGRGYPEVAVGRLPVNTPADLTVAVNRIVSYAAPQSSGVVLQAVADRADPTTADFPAQAESLAQANPELTWQRNYLGVTYQSSPEVSAAMLAAANGGANWILYVDHGNASRLGKDDPRILQSDSVRDNVQDWTGNVVFLQSTCTANWMATDQTGAKTIAIQLLTQPQGGISASIASSTYMNSDYGVAFMGQLLKNTAPSGARWGTALMQTQQWAYGMGAGFYSDLNKTEQIFGDPAMPIYSKPRAGAPPPTTPGTTPVGPCGRGDVLRKQEPRTSVSGHDARKKKGPLTHVCGSTQTESEAHQWLRNGSVQRKLSGKNCRTTRCW